LGIDTLICGELREHHFSVAQALNLNLYPCGHYATERFGIATLGELVAKKFSLDCDFIEMNNPL
jgi:putative NIF3 family GTP cyclohydrolase 1 type 2